MKTIKAWVFWLPLTYFAFRASLRAVLGKLPQPEKG